MQEIHLNTVGGASNVLSLDISTTDTILRRFGRLTQVGVGVAPTDVVAIDEIPNFNWSYKGLGTYEGTSIGAFASNNNLIISGIENNAVGKNAFSSIERSGDDIITVKTTFNDAGTNKLADNFLKQTDYQITTVTNPITTSEEMFNAVIRKMDGNQLAIWTKIVTRLNGVVIEVYGDKYRKLGTYSGSFKEINS